MRRALRESRPARLATPDGELNFVIRYSRRRSLGLYVYADGRVEVRVPFACDEHVAMDFLQRRLSWVMAKRAEFAERPRPPQPEYRSGAQHLYLGERLTLKLQYAARPQVWLTDDRLTIAARDIAEPEKVEQRLWAWYRRTAEALFPERLALGVARMHAYGIVQPPLKIRRMRSRWGSCSRRGSITLNLDLIRYPLACLDYVIAHELCHLLEFNHSPRFYRLLDATMPDWRTYKMHLTNGDPARPID
ncbi:hypothetical protein CAI21_17580 [Alkalilimnicola ehrlichii]|uniref:YgjP-like metallopeptidase domain-containing protein n=1 Tax=Alkalilimnicola ehrlichii TaxID=351052 RepID=A0A3E0WHA9_9GAMM|nr:SprT family zinc-dependent metalloprotease [Alkalilimnicola ehrlichii]RFA26145.1 hypothetical protein CAI21_17580 [Alkalilimnicola ehrlichii]RFA32360.1 hypothetical protein CAL65_19960 [Alkalilimnicola ehrlichii]